MAKSFKKLQLINFFFSLVDNTRVFVLPISS